MSRLCLPPQSAAVGKSSRSAKRQVERDETATQAIPSVKRYFGTEEPVRADQEQRRHGLVLPLQARDGPFRMFAKRATGLKAVASRHFRSCAPRKGTIADAHRIEKRTRTVKVTGAGMFGG